ncbi:MAG: hypothetical protein A2Y33_05950 [Spirochaetes bacterium GWF1_51_8]|nr:MAG: hypothetical protein A2Y33_05950 [Spirochaetes bacterium GWF1_51_8]
MSESCKIKSSFRAAAKDIYEAWMSSAGHTAMTGSPALVDSKVGGKFSAWDGYIWGITLELAPYKRIVQVWRTSDFGRDDRDSKIEIQLTEKNGETEFVLIHDNIPDGQMEEYLEGWNEFYLDPMHDYFNGRKK